MKNRKRSSPALPSGQLSAPVLAVSGAESKWFYGSGLDLIIGCGAWSAPLLLVAYFCSSNYPGGVSIAFYMLALVFNYPHYMATIYRAYRSREDFAKYKIFTLHLTLLVGLLVIATHVSHQLLAIVFTLYLTWSPFHYTGQNFGIALLFARRNGVKTTKAARRALYISFLAPYAMLLLAVHSFPSTDQYIMRLGIPLDAARVLWVAILVVFLISTISTLSAFVKQTGWRAMTAPIVMVSTQAAWFVIPTGLTLFSDVDLLQARATAGILAVMHSAQYLWITSYYARRESQVGQPDRDGFQGKRWRPYAYFFVLIVGGIALFVPGPWLASKIVHIDFTTSFLAFTALINIHHFMLDGAIWKLRDGRIASLLLNSPGVENGERAASRFNQLTVWLTSTRKSARLFRVAAAFSLLLAAGLDQMKFYYGARADDVASLRRAQKFNSYDAGLQFRLARANEHQGNHTEYRAALEQAILINPNHQQAQLALAKLLIESGQYEEAYRHYQRMFVYLKPDVDSLVNFGLLASQLNHQGEAIDSWQRALNLDPDQINAHLYLADALANKKQFKEAIPHYEQYLARISKNASVSKAGVSRPSPDVILKVVLQLAKAFQESGEDQKAVEFLSKGVTLAEKLGDKPGLTLALVYSGDNKARRGKLVEALSDFQRALSIEHSGSFGEQAIDWFKYGKFLQSAGASPRLSFACFTKAEVLLRSDKNSSEEIQSETVEGELKATEAVLDVAMIKSIQSNLDPVLQEALTIKF
jgi:tetratricopeptide (TPR) repeat protein